MNIASSLLNCLSKTDPFFYNRMALIIHQYCHVSRVCVTNKTDLDLMIEFIGPLYNLLKQFPNHCLTHVVFFLLDTPRELF
jgi:hypothetical protein